MEPNNNENLISIDDMLDKEYGKVGTASREQFREEAYAYYIGQIICQTRKEEKMTQTELAEKIGTNKTYISRVENGAIETKIGTLHRIITALGLKIELVKTN